jgi:DNA-binding NarL/FixJ family response regulator
MIVHPYPSRPAELLRSDSRPDVFILDLETVHDALGTITQIREAASTSKIVLLCGFEDQIRTREAFAAGVDGIILKVQPPEVVLAVIEALYTSAMPQIPVELNATSRIGLTKKVESLSSPAWPEALTEREREIIRLVEEGLSNKDIAYRLSISDSTVRHHMTSIFDKVGVPNRQKLLVHAHHFRSTAG